MFRFPLFILITLIVAFGGGIMISLYALDATQGFGAIKLGAWEAFPELQTVDADPYAKSHRARAGKLLYGSAEGLTFTASVDDSGERLNAACHYRISGQTPPARLWTLFTADNAGNPASLQQALPAALNSCASAAGNRAVRYRRAPGTAARNWSATWHLSAGGDFSPAG